MRTSIFLSMLLVLALKSYSQQPLKLQLASRGEVLVEFDAEYLKQIPNVGSWSVDNVKAGKALVYLNNEQYETLIALNIPFIPQTTPSLLANVKMAHSIDEMKNWDAYPDYETYLAMMQQFTIDYPQLCMLDTIGYTVEGRLLLALKISDNVSVDESEPEFFYTSSMHGDELTGYVLMLRLADYLLRNHQVTKGSNIIDNLEIYINPLANPDGTFAAGNLTVNGAIRENANNVNINRNFPDPKRGSHPDGKDWQLETLAMIEYMENRNFGMSMNFHDGAELLNYPWDTFSERHIDTEWFKFISQEYVDKVHEIDANYMTDQENGITNGFDWYEVAGGRQDYVTYFLHGREITTELCNTKLVDANQLPSLWNKNYQSFITFMDQATYGIHGLVTDREGNPLQAKITVLNHDDDSSHVRTQTGGVFYRYLKGGVYDVEIQSEGYLSQTFNVEVKDFEATSLQVQLELPLAIQALNAVEFDLYPNPAKSRVNITLPELANDACLLQISAVDGKVIYTKSIQSKVNVNLDLINIPSGLYFVNITSTQGSKTKKLLVN